jgi:DNA-binding NarL/FixJ family response regulator
VSVQPTRRVRSVRRARSALGDAPADAARRGVPSGGEAPSVVIADDHPAMRLGVRMALIRGGFRVVAEVADAEGAVRAAAREQPDVCLLDVYMPGGGIEAARRISELTQKTSVVMLTVCDSAEQVLAALRAGAVGYLPKDTSPDSLPAALCGVLKGEAALPRALVGVVLDRFRDYTAAVEHPVLVQGVQLTARESEILRMLRSGLKTAEIGELLSLSPITVRRHISAGVAKLGVADRDAAVRAIAPAAA